MTTSCPCGSRFCGTHNRAYFFRRTGKLGKAGNRKVRAEVFRWDERQSRREGRVWTWCPVVRGERVDNANYLGHYDSWGLAYADAMAWVAGRYGHPAHRAGAVVRPRPRNPEPDADSTAGRLIAATARTRMRNFALDVRNALNPPRRR